MFSALHAILRDLTLRLTQRRYSTLRRHSALPRDLASPDVNQAEPSVCMRIEDDDVSETDDLLDEIDDVLEENAEDFVRAYVQKGGQ